MIPMTKGAEFEVSTFDASDGEILVSFCVDEISINLYLKRKDAKRLAAEIMAEILYMDAKMSEKARVARMKEAENEND